MEYLLQSKLIDFENPEKSLLLRKPLGEVKHEGGVKFAPGDQGYKAFRAWIDDVAAIRAGKYESAKDLPPKDTGSKRFGTEVWLKITNTQGPWADELLAVEVFAWDEGAKAWEKDPVATSDRVVFGKGKLWQHSLTLLAAPGSERAKAWATGKPQLRPGKYLVKVYVDAGDRTKKDWKATLGPDDYVGSVEVDARWAEGYGAMTAVDGGKVKK
jgi:hypothetical protein